MQKLKYLLLSLTLFSQIPAWSQEWQEGGLSYRYVFDQATCFYKLVGINSYGMVVSSTLIEDPTFVPAGQIKPIIVSCQQPINDTLTIYWDSITGGWYYITSGVKYFLDSDSAVEKNAGEQIELHCDATNSWYFSDHAGVHLMPKGWKPHGTMRSSEKGEPIKKSSTHAAPIKGDEHAKQKGKKAEDKEQRTFLSKVVKGRVLMGPPSTSEEKKIRKED